MSGQERITHKVVRIKCFSNGWRITEIIYQTRLTYGGIEQLLACIGHSFPISAEQVEEYVTKNRVA